MKKTFIGMTFDEQAKFFKESERECEQLQEIARKFDKDNKRHARRQAKIASLKAEIARLEVKNKRDWQIWLAAMGRSIEHNRRIKAMFDELNQSGYKLA